MSRMSIKVIDHATQRVVCDRLHASLPVRIGRDPGNDVCLNFEFVSSWHAELREGADGGLLLCDLGSRNPLKVGGLRLGAASSVALSLPESVTLGPLELRFERPAERGVAEVSVGVDGLPDFSGGASSLPDQAGVIEDDPLPRLAEPDESRVPSRIRRIQEAVRRLRPLHAQLDTARRQWEDSLNKEVRAVREQVAADGGDVAKEHDMGMLLRSFPPADRGGFGLALEGGVLGGGPELAAVVQAAGELLPGMRTPTNEDETRRFLARVVDVLRVFAAATLEVQHVRRRQAVELGVRWEEPPDPLIALETADEVLRYLLDWRDAGESRSEELVRSLAAVVDHLQAYVRASLAATRKVLVSLSPMEIERGAVDRWPTRASALWSHYQRSYAALVGEEHDHLSPAFQAVFAEAYRDTLARAGVPTRSEDKKTRRRGR